jgi:SM-20-related protein
MHPEFDKLIQSFIDDKIGIDPAFITKRLSLLLKDKIESLYAGKQLQLAGTGNAVTVHHDKLIRSDVIFWLDRIHNDKTENEFFDLMDAFVIYLNQTCYTGITGYEFHYTLYESGSFYKRHLDQFRSNSSRKYSMILYLNKDWVEADGGELCIYQDGGSQNISPEEGKMVFFKSDELEHEVLVTHKPRMSITGWLKVDA